VKLLTLKPGEKLQDISLVIPDGEDSTVDSTTDSSETFDASDETQG
jgi:hypothetical protein